MSATQYEAFRGFVEKTLSIDDPLTSIFRGKTDAQAVDEAVAILEPFLLNPERHKAHISLIVMGLKMSFQLQQFEEDRPLFLKLMKLSMRMDPRLASQLKHVHQKYIDTLRLAQKHLYNNIEAGDIKLDLLPVQYLKPSEVEQYGEFRLLGLRLNVAVQPSNGINAQSLSVKIEADNEKFQFSDTTPSTRVESIGSHELGISDAGKFTKAENKNEKVVAKMSVVGVAADAELAEERSSSIEISRSENAKVTRVDVAPAIISATVGNTAQWDFLRTPTQPRIGGFQLAATAFIPKHLEATKLSISALVQFQGWGPQLRTIQREIAFRPEGAPQGTEI